jgi:hypothetical protein
MLIVFPFGNYFHDVGNYVFGCYRRETFGLVIVVALCCISCRNGDDSNSKPDRTKVPSKSPAQDDPDPSSAQLAASDQSQAATNTVSLSTDSVGEQSWSELDDPESEGWHTEAFNVVANKQLKALGQLIIYPEHLSAEQLKKVVTETVQSTGLAPADLTTVYEDQSLRVQRGTDGSAEGKDELIEHRGAQQVVVALKESLSPLLRTENRRFKFKLFRVKTNGPDMVTRQYLDVSGETDDQIVEQHCTWVIRWNSQDTNQQLPRIDRIELAEFERVTTTQPGGVLFADCTESVLGKTPNYESQLLHGLNYWNDRGQDNHPSYIYGLSGIAIGDVNGDGLEDVYLCQEHALPNRLFLQNDDGTLRDYSRESGTDWLHSSRGPLLVDLDNDGDRDLAVAIFGGVVLAENDGFAHFCVRNVLATDDDTTSLAAADFDLDGRLDLYVCGYQRDSGLKGGDEVSTPRGSAGLVYGDANDGARGYLFRNQIEPQGDWKFADVTSETGLDQNNTRWSLAAAWEDYDNDGDMDLYVSNDSGRNNLYRNDWSQGAGFRDVAAEAGVDDRSFSMSITWGDYDRDGWLDAYISNMWSSAGNRITRQKQFKPSMSTGDKGLYQYLARGNTLLRNLGDGSFADVSVAVGVTMGRWAWSSNFVDLNNDGWQDLFVANGYITTDDTGDL